MTVVDRVRELISKQLEEIGDEEKRLQSALAELDGKVRRSPGRPKRSGATAPTRSALPKGEPGEAKPMSPLQTEVLRYLKEHPTATAKDVGSALKIKPGHVYNLMTKSRKQGQLERGGNREHVVSVDFRGMFRLYSPDSVGASKPPPDALSAKDLGNCAAPKRRRKRRAKGAGKAPGKADGKPGPKPRVRAAAKSRTAARPSSAAAKGKNRRTSAKAAA